MKAQISSKSYCGLWNALQTYRNNLEFMLGGTIDGEMRPTVNIRFYATDIDLGKFYIICIEHNGANMT